MGWDVPVWAHIPLIHGPDGKKLSKRHGALGVEEYQAMGYPPPACGTIWRVWAGAMGMTNFSPMRRRKEWFDSERHRQIPGAFDFKKLENICGQHIASANDDAALLQ